MTPFLKWAGGKRALAKTILGLFPSICTKGRYYEPFFGAGAVWAAMPEPRPRTCILSDANSELIATLKGVRAYTAESINHALIVHESQHSEGYYYDVRAWDWTSFDSSDVAARMIYLNKAGFNGLYRVNKAGAFNTPYGHREKLSLPSFAELEAWSEALMGAVLMCADFQDATRDAHSGDWVYFDPPYIPTKPDGFTGYQAEKFGRAEHERLAKVARTLSDKGVHVVLSNSDTALTRELYPKEWFELFEVTRSGAMNSDGTKRGRVTELLMRGRI